MNPSTVVGIIAGLGFVGVASAVASKVTASVGESDISQYIRVAAISGSSLVAIGLAIKALKFISTL